MPNCKVCGRAYRATASRQAYCSKPCYRAVQKLRKRNERAAARAEHLGHQEDYPPHMIEHLYQQALAANRASGRYQLDPWETRTSRLDNPYWDTRGI